MMQGNWWRALKAGDRCMERSRSRPRMCRWSGRQAISKWQLANSKKPKPKSNQNQIQRRKPPRRHGGTEKIEGKAKDKSKSKNKGLFPLRTQSRKRHIFPILALSVLRFYVLIRIWTCAEPPAWRKRQPSTQILKGEDT